MSDKKLQEIQSALQQGIPSTAKSRTLSTSGTATGQFYAMIAPFGNVVISAIDIPSDSNDAAWVGQTLPQGLLVFVDFISIARSSGILVVYER